MEDFILRSLWKYNFAMFYCRFTTLTAVPGVINYKGAKIQLLDLPGIIEGAAQGKGRGRQVISVAKTADVVSCVFVNHQLMFLRSSVIVLILYISYETIKQLWTLLSYIWTIKHRYNIFLWLGYRYHCHSVIVNEDDGFDVNLFRFWWCWTLAKVKCKRRC